MIKSITAAAILAVTACQPAMAQDMVCGQTLDIWEGLALDYGEMPQSIAVDDSGTAVMETWANEDTGSWTVLGTTPDGVSCIIMHGMGWQNVAKAAGQPA